MSRLRCTLNSPRLSKLVRSPPLCCASWPRCCFFFLKIRQRKQKQTFSVVQEYLSPQLASSSTASLAVINCSSTESPPSALGYPKRIHSSMLPKREWTGLQHRVGHCGPWPRVEVLWSLTGSGRVGYAPSRGNGHWMRGARKHTGSPEQHFQVRNRLS